MADFQVALLPSDQIPETTRSPLAQRLRVASGNAPSLPLQGLRIALDPGHMGGRAWDQVTGKFVVDSKGRRLSEGVIALQTALLLEQELRRLGATTMVTRRKIGPVAPSRPDDLDLKRLGLIELQESIFDPWFENLISANKSDQDLLRSIRNSDHYSALFEDTEDNRYRYFIGYEDLTARAEAINSFHPDITLIIHYDANTNHLSSSADNGVKTYVAGRVSESQLATREDRALFAEHLLEPVAWPASVALSQSIVKHLSSRLDMPPDPWGAMDSARLSPGVYARNLFLSRKLTRQVTSYVECMHYDRVREFRALSDTTHPLLIDGENVPYSDRMLDIVAGLRDGVVEFVRSYPQTLRFRY